MKGVFSPDSEFIARSGSDEDFIGGIQAADPTYYVSPVQCELSYQDEGQEQMLCRHFH
ncbi:MAG: hypothetical protein U1B83_02520 [Candidatus Cloacimonadaceae bacterium]|nr:hypothetical protein [Candidatus Cloacimonadaceae bacterium]